MMNYLEFQQLVKSQMENWLNEKIIQDDCGNETEIKKVFLLDICAIIDSKFNILTDEELMDKMTDFHDCMEGLG